MADLPGRLNADEKKYSVDMKDLPEDLWDDSPNMVRRAAVINEKTGVTRLAVDWRTKMPSAWGCTDGGADTWQHRLKLFYKLGVRGGEKYDPPHRAVRVRDRAINKADGAWVKSEYGVIFAYVRGPWSSEANFQLISGGSKERFANFDENFILFKNCCYERICRSRNNGALPPAFGTPSI